MAEIALACTAVICNYITGKPKHWCTSNIRQEIHMTAQLSTKIAALAIALMVNCMMIGGVAYLFGGRIHAAPLQALAQTAALATPPAA
jgi:hypothetical protein